MAEQTTLEWLLLPCGMTFQVFENDEGAYYPKISHLALALPIAVLLSLFRKFVVEGQIARRIGKAYGLKNVVLPKPVQDPVLLAVYRKSRRGVPADKVEELCKATGMTERQIERWWKAMRQQGKPGTLAKFEEAFWRALFYIVSFIFGAAVVTTSPFFWDTDLLWIKNPLHHVPDKFFWYYTVELGMYISLVVTQFTDVRRKDFAEMFVHHIVTIALIVMSWWANMIRIGTMVLFYHDMADIFLEVAKLFNYMKKNDISFSIFTVFAVVFIVSRLVCYPWHVVAGTFTTALKFLDPNFVACNIFRALLCMLILLHLLWAKTIASMVLDLVRGTLKGDQRSDDEDDDDDGADDADKPKAE